MKVEITVSEDRMQAYVTLRKEGSSELPLTKEELLNALRSAGINHGIKEEIIEDLARSPVYNTPVLVAEGTPPVDGDDGRVELLKRIEFTSQEGEKIDLREIPAKQRMIVRKGETIARIIPPTPGKEGIDVFGNPVKPRPGRVPEYHLGYNVTMKDNEIIATKSGILVIETNGTIHVYDTLEVDNVDYSTGNIDFPGKVVVKGDVKPDFVVKAQEDITVKGVIEAATVISFNGSITAGGIKGRGKAFVKAKKTVKAVFVENAEVEAEEVQVEKNIENSTVKAINVVVSGKGGSIRGGITIARVKVETCFLGSPIGVKTRIEVGVDPEINEKIKLLSAQISLDRENVQKLTKLLVELRKLQGILKDKFPPDKEALLNKVNNTLINLRDSIQKNEGELKKLKEIAEEMAKNASVVVKEVVYPGVEIVMFERVFRVEKELTKAVFYYRDGEIRVGGYSA
ncbi:MULTISPECIES: DUF342 domain-containing protein [unclassified Thermotoga]|uniref:DUF342 domain-containing protein n=1 Tax=unclassified Thermotoga TaxID=2631113 RepID=UPI000541340A|nr:MULTISPECIES: FapA family protein [unclassified Thermotoga]AIY87560.1 hypothetical protein CELL2_01010 [Thermotoga sp. Cell2]KHC92489.1 hypothetical protein TBGT1765_05441 [Thermotoga sp. TBGT1765]KHC93460.1 hypothetical protein TBGT1766_05133 [Thermotoga sp. TBGT1766]KHC96497.1 hypothetical protein XYL54_04871 [Thermotoga sp. Xyl54]